MHSLKVILVCSVILAVAFAEVPAITTHLKDDDLVAAKELLTTALDKLPGTKYNVVNWLSAESVVVYEYVVDVSDGLRQNECTFKISQSSPIIENGTHFNMRCQGGYKLNYYW